MSAHLPRKLARGAHRHSLIAVVSLLLLTEAACGALQPTIPDSVAAEQIAQKFVQDQCAEYFTVGPVAVLDKKVTGDQATVSFSVRLTKTAAFEEKMEHRTLLTMGMTNCSADFDIGRFHALEPVFYGHPVGTAANYTDTATFEKWQSGWKLAP